MFTDENVTAKHAVTVNKETGTGSGCFLILFHVFLNLILGPIAWIFTALARGRLDVEPDSTTKMEKIKVKVAICRLCKPGGLPEVVDVQTNPQGLMMKVHPRYMDALKTFANVDE